jgi:predicted PurR-regulated permease PerM
MAINKRFFTERTVDKFKIAGIASWAIIGVIGLIYISSWAIGQIGLVMRPFFFAVIMVVLLKPILDFLENKGMNRTAALAVTYIFFFALLVIILVFLIPAGISEVNQLIKAWPGYQKAVNSSVVHWQSSYRTFAMPAQVTNALDSALADAQTSTFKILTKIPSYTVSFISLLLDFVLAPLIAFFILKDRAALSKGFFKVVPEAWRPESKYLAYRMNVVIQDVLRIMLLLAVVVSILATAGLFIARVPYAVLLGFIGGFMQIIPYIGPVAGTLPAVIVAWITKGGWYALGIGIYFAVLTQIASVVLTPIMMKDRVGVNPVLLLFILLLFGALFGFWGIVMAVPAAAVIHEIGAFALMTEDERAEAIKSEGIPT